jgi:hypothetical protein
MASNAPNWQNQSELSLSLSNGQIQNPSEMKHSAVLKHIKRSTITSNLSSMKTINLLIHLIHDPTQKKERERERVKISHSAVAARAIWGKESISARMTIQPSASSCSADHSRAIPFSQMLNRKRSRMDGEMEREKEK